MVQQVTMLHSKALGFWWLGSATRIKLRVFSGEEQRNGRSINTYDLLQVWNHYDTLLKQCVRKRQSTTSSIVLNGLATSDGVVFHTLCFSFLELPSKCFHVWHSSEYRGCLPVAPVTCAILSPSPADFGQRTNCVWHLQLRLFCKYS